VRDHLPGQACRQRHDRQSRIGRALRGKHAAVGDVQPVDAEDPNDRGAFLRWIATDAERKDDVGIPMPPNPLVQCRTFPGVAYDFPDIKYAGGDLQVQDRR